MTSAVPPRGPALAGLRWLLSFDVDCGELITGHRFVARGPQDAGPLAAADEVKPVDPSAVVAGLSLQYELAPGVPAEAADGPPFPYLVGVNYHADVPLPWEVRRCARDLYGRTYDARIPRELAPAARRDRLDLHSLPVRRLRLPEKKAAGQLIVDLRSGSACWRSTAATVGRGESQA